MGLYPQVSIIMATHNRAHLIGRAIRHILSQKIEDFELIIVDDGSIDNTKEVVSNFQDPRIIYFKQDHKGAPAAWNLALKQAKGEYITQCDDDDAPYDIWLSTLCSYLSTHSDLGLVYGDVIHKGTQLLSYTDRSVDFNKERLEVDCFFQPVSALYRKECAELVGGFDESEILTEHGEQDHDLWLRIADNYKIVHIPKIIATAYVHGSNFLHRGNNALAQMYIVEKRLKKFNEVSRGRYIAPYTGYFLRWVWKWVSTSKAQGRLEVIIPQMAKMAKKFVYYDEQNFETWLALCCCLYIKGDKREAIEVGKKALALFPSHINFLRFGFADDVAPWWMCNTCIFLAQALAEKGEIHLALKYAEKAVEIGNMVKIGSENIKVKYWFDEFRRQI